MKRITIVYAAIVLCLCSICKAQPPILVNKLLTWKKVVAEHNIEKVHIHTNQPFYGGYDTVWFKAYVVDSYFNQPSAISKIIYAEIIAPDGKLIKHTALPLIGGTASGYFALNDSLRSGNYTLSAYTNNMQAYGAEYAYRRPLIIQSNKPAVKVAPQANLQAALQFFPEGGDMVNGLRSTVAFKAINPNGLSVGVKGDIVDNEGKTVARFTSEHAGMGSFAFTPVAGHTYMAKATFADGHTGQVQLKEALPTGYAMGAAISSNTVALNLQCSEALVGKGLMTLIGVQDGVTRYLTRFGFASGAQKITVPDSLLYSGVAQFTLFDPQGNAVAERLIFVNHHSNANIGLQFKKEYAVREKVGTPVSFNNASGQPEAASLSVSVYNESELPGDDDTETSIYTDMLLTADLKGYIETPGYYFNQPADTTRAHHLDQLLLTQGWRRFSWKNQLSKTIPVVQDSIANGLAINGQINTPSNKPFVKGPVTLFQNGHPENSKQTTTDELGNFRFENLMFADTSRFIISTNTLDEKKKNKIIVNTDRPNIRPIAGVAYSVIDSLLKRGMVNSQNDLLNNMLKNGRSTQLEEVKIESTAKKAKVIQSSNLNGAGRADNVITADDLKYVQDLSRYLLDHVGGLKPFQGKIYNRELPDPGQTPAPPAMLVVMDGVQFSQETFDISNVDPNNVGTIEVLKNAGSIGLYGLEGSGGVIIITSKTGKDYAASVQAIGLIPITRIGYETPREFYSPQYPAKIADSKPDFRKAVYWNPNVVALPGKTPQINFFNSDFTGGYKVVVEGITADGAVARSVYRYEVKK